MATVEIKQAEAPKVRKGRPPSQIKSLRTQIVAHAKAMMEQKDLEKLLKHAGKLLSKQHENASAAEAPAAEVAPSADVQPVASVEAPAVAAEAPVETPAVAAEAPKKRGRKPKAKVAVTPDVLETQPKPTLTRGVSGRLVPQLKDQAQLMREKAEIEAQIALNAARAAAEVYVTEQ